MAVITLPDGSLGYTYPTKPNAYAPTKTEYVGAIIPPNHRGTTPDIVIREAAGTYRGNPTAKDPSGFYWVAPVAPDGTIGTMTTRYVYAEELRSTQP